MSLYPQTVPRLIKMLDNLDSWLQEAIEYAETRNFPADNLLQARLAPDMFPLVRQIQSVCDNAKFIGARLSGVEAPKHPDTETTIAELRGRIGEVKAFLADLDPASFEGAEKKELFLPYLRGNFVYGGDYVAEFAMPNVFFHLNMAYALLRHNGVSLGKMKYIGGMTVHTPPS